MAHGCTINVLDFFMLGLVFAIVVVSNLILTKAIVVSTNALLLLLPPFGVWQPITIDLCSMLSRRLLLEKFKSLKVWEGWRYNYERP